MKVLRNLENSIRNIICLPWSIIFNFHYLPVKQAVKLPILFQVIPTFLSLKGKVKITNENIHRGMIILGAKISCQNERKKFRWQCHGTVVFGGEGILIGQQSFIHVGEKAILEIGQQSTFSLNLKIFCRNRIAFKDKNRVSWNCTFIDTDFHPLIDMVRHKSIPESNPIIIGRGSWIGHDCIVSKGSYLAENTTVSSGSVVKGHFKQPYTIIGGNPAIVIDEGYKRDDV